MPSAVRAAARRTAASIGAVLLGWTLVSCGTGVASERVDRADASATADGTGAPGTGQAQRNSSARPVAKGERHELADGLVVTVSSPRSFVPTEGSTPQAQRAVAFDLTLDNDGTASYRAARLGVAAWVDGAKTAQLVDTTQGYSGTVDPASEVRPGGTLRLSVAFAVGAKREPLRVTVQPAVGESTPVTVFDAVA
ncbi:MAG TPA: hypothetical protein VNB91_02540 [Jatrophihabitantaceae bacterium]|nr:hypothetical protein [Jatrophihabitantaceae bacterium]